MSDICECEECVSARRWITEKTGVGGGPRPLAFLIASHEQHERELVGAMSKDLQVHAKALAVEFFPEPSRLTLEIVSKHIAAAGERGRQRVFADPEALARRFHETYEQLAPEYGYETRKESAVPWEKVPEKNRRLMIAVCAALAQRDSGRGFSNADEPFADLVAAKARQMTSPDSDAREVCGVNWNPNLGPHYPCALPAGHEGRHEYLAAEAMAVLPLPLAQRILAALGAAGHVSTSLCLALAAELRERMGQKP